MLIRRAIPADAAACAAVYAPYVRDTVITFELEAPSAAVMLERITTAQRDHEWLVAERDGRVVGYAYGGRFAARPAYRWACEVSVYLEMGVRRSGAGRGLYEALFDALATRGYRTALAGMTLPNPASEGLHRALGFESVGVYRDIGWKQDAWHDVAWRQRRLGPADDPPAPLR